MSLLIGACSIAQPEARYEAAIPVEVVLSEVGKQATAAANHLEQAPARVMVVLVRGEMRPQIVDASRQDRDLDLRRAGVAVLDLEVADNSLLALCLQSQSYVPPHAHARAP